MQQANVTLQGARGIATPTVQARGTFSLEVHQLRRL